MAVVGAIAGALFSAASGAVAAVGSAIASSPLTAAAVGIGTHATISSAKAAEEARSDAKKRALEEQLLFREQQELQAKQAGEYYNITAQQMELQAQSANIQTLANLIEKKSQPGEPVVFTMPAAKEYSAVDRINQAIGELLGV